MAKKLFEGTENQTPVDSRRIPLGYPGINGSEFIQWSDARSEILGNIDSLTLNTPAPVITTARTVIWNDNEYTIDIITGLGATIQVGQEQLILYVNNTGGTITNGKILHKTGGTTVGDTILFTVEYADASEHDKCNDTIFIATHDVLNGEIGFATRFGKLRDYDTTSFGANAKLFISLDGSGDLTATKPAFPNYSIYVAQTLNSSATGEIFVNVIERVEDTFNDAWDGACRESFDFLVTSNGTTVTGTLTNVDPTLNLDLKFSDVGLYTFDTTSTPATIALTPGTDSLAQNNFIYIPISTKILTKSTSDWPTTEHVKIAQLKVQSAATVQSEGGAERNQNINDHIKSENDNGHILHIAQRIRRLNADHDSGTEATLTGTPTNAYIQVTGGYVWQMHKQVFQSFSMPTRNIIIRNDFTTPNIRTNNLNTITAYSTGSTWNNEWGKIVVWGVANKTGEVDFVKLNLPSAGYNSEAAAVADGSNYADYTIPADFKGVGFLIASFTIRISGGSITYNSGVGYQDLRGFIPNNIAGGGGGSGVTTFLGLNDVLTAAYTGLANYQATVNSGETGIELTEQEDAGVGVAKGHVTASAQNFAGYKGFSNTNTPLAAVDVGDGEFFRGTFSTQLVGESYPIIIKMLETQTTNFGVSLLMKVYSITGNAYGWVFKVKKQNITTQIEALEIDSDGVISIPVAPAAATVTHPVLYRNSSTGAIEQFRQLKQTSVTSSSTPTPTGDSRENELYITALAIAATIAAPSGTAVNGNNLIIRIKDNGTARTLAWNAIYRAVGVTLPLTTVISKTLYVGCIYNSADTKWDVVSVVQEA